MLIHTGEQHKRHRINNNNNPLRDVSELRDDIGGKRPKKKQRLS
jgi:hypothetical protein